MISTSNYVSYSMLAIILQKPQQKISALCVLHPPLTPRAVLLCCIIQLDEWWWFPLEKGLCFPTGPLQSFIMRMFFSAVFPPILQILLHLTNKLLIHLLVVKTGTERDGPVLKSIVKSICNQDSPCSSLFEQARWCPVCPLSQSCCPERRVSHLDPAEAAGMGVAGLACAKKSANQFPDL